MNQRPHPDKDLTDAERRINNLVLIGTIAELDPAGPKVRVTAGPITSGWLPFATTRAGGDRDWHPPEPGEQVVCACPCGDINQGVIIGSIYRDIYPAPGCSPDISRKIYLDGATAEYNRLLHNALLDVPAGGRITLRIGLTVLTLQADQATLTTPRLVVDSPDSTFTGHVSIRRGLSVHHSGADADGYTAEFVGLIRHRDGDYQQINGSHIVTGGDVAADGIGLKPHRHMEQGDGNPTGPSIT